MGLLNNLKLRFKFLVLTILTVVAMVALGFYSLSVAQRMATASNELYQDNALGIQQTSDAKIHFLEISTAVYQHVASYTTEEWVNYEKSLEQSEKDLDDALTAYEAGRHTQKERELLATIRQNVAAYEQAIPAILQASRQDQDRVAKDLTLKVRSVRRAALAALEDLVVVNVEGAKAQNATNTSLARSSRTMSTILILVAAILSGALGMLIGETSANALREIVRLLKKTEDLDFAYDASFVPLTKRKDEIGAIASSTGAARKAIREMIGQVANTAEQVAASSEQLASSAQTVGQVTGQVTETIGQLAKGADEQAKAAQDAGNVVENMSSAIQQVDASAQNMAQGATSAVRIAEDGQRSLDQAVGQMSVIAETSHRAATSVQALGERSGQIGQIVEVITGIADQTNLLALNAAIEAARAGEQGRGFAVVAEEVRKLAEQSRQAAEQISGLIGEIQRETGTAVTSMDSGAREVAAGTEVVGKAGEAFTSIAKAVQAVVAQIQAVSAATESLSAGSDQVVKSVESIAAITQEAAAGAEEVNASAEEQSASVQEIAASAESLSELAQKMLRAVSQFKL